MPFKAPAFPRRFQQSHPFQRQQRQQPQLQYKQERGQEVEETSDDSSALEASRAAMIARDGPVAMPTSLVVPRDDEYYEAATAKVQPTVQERGRAVAVAEVATDGASSEVTADHSLGEA